LLSEFASRLLESFGAKLRIRGVIPTSPALIVANHVSYVDPLLILSVAPSMPVAKLEAHGWPLVGPALGALGVLFVDRGHAMSGAAVLRRASKILAGGASVLTFPEGTTTDGTTVLPFRQGVFHIARRLGVEVVPALVRYEDPRVSWTGGAAFLPHFLRLSALDSFSAELCFGVPVCGAHFTGAAAFGQALREELSAQLSAR
jgi:1-acyl-sn-glycerol-3-phosphate acyltransferase